MSDSKKTGLFPTPNTMDGMKPRSAEALAMAKQNAGCSNLKDFIVHPDQYQKTQSNQQELSLQVDSHARTLVSQESKQASTVKGQVYGQSLPELLATYDPTTRSLRTSQHSLLETEAGGLTEYSETWPKSGCLVNGTVFALESLTELSVQAHRIEGSGSGLWPTPRTPSGGPDNSSKSLRPSGHRGTTNLAGAVLGQMWPTPRAGKTTDEKEETWMKRKNVGAVSTPPLTLAVKMDNSESGQLNPAWVCWLLGLPLDYLDLDGYQNPELEGLPPEYLTG